MPLSNDYANKLWRTKSGQTCAVDTPDLSVLKHGIAGSGWAGGWAGMYGVPAASGVGERCPDDA